MADAAGSKAEEAAAARDAKSDMDIDTSGDKQGGGATGDTGAIANHGKTANGNQQGKTTAESRKNGDSMETDNKNKEPQKGGGSKMVTGPPPCIVIDNGSYSMKVGMAGEEKPRRVMPNCIARSAANRKYVGDAIEKCEDPSTLQFKRAFDKGYLLNWDLMEELWDRAFSKDVLGIMPSDHSLLVTEPLFNMEPLQDTMDEFVFEVYGFKEYCSTSSACLSNISYQAATPGATPVTVVVDSGYSFSHIVPLFDNFKLNYAVKRVDVGGKVLTNYLKELMTYREYNMMEETYLMDEVKRQLCYVAADFKADQAISRQRGPANTIRREYVLPDYRANNWGYVRGDTVTVWRDRRAGETDADKRGPEQVLTVNNERFSVAELLFNPSDIGIQQGGLAEATAQAIQAMPVDMQGPAYHNIVLTGGNAKLPGFEERLLAELRPLVPSEYASDVRVTTLPDPETAVRAQQIRLLLLPLLNKLQRNIHAGLERWVAMATDTRLSNTVIFCGNKGRGNQDWPAASSVHVHKERLRGIWSLVGETTDV